MTHPTRLVVVILTWNGRDDTLACLDSLRDQVGPDDHVIVVDNASTDDTEVRVRAAHSWVEFVRNSTNLGFAGGNNVGLRRALAGACRLVLILNNDTLVPAGTIDGLVAHADACPTVDVFQPLLVRADAPDVIDSAGHVAGRTPGISDALHGRPVSEAPTAPTEILGACAAAALVRADTLRRVGLFDEAFFVIAEDADLMLRIRADGGLVQLVPHLRVLHRRGISGGTPSVEGARRRKLWLQRNTVALGIRHWPLGGLVRGAPVLKFRMAQALWLTLGVPGERCLPLWWRSLCRRRASRRAMRRHGVDAWLGRAVDQAGETRATRTTL